MALINEKDREHLKKAFDNLAHKVKLVMFTQETECQFCRETRSICEELAEISDHIETEVFDFVKDKDPVEQYRIDKIPAVAVVGDKDYGIRYYGIPAGYEFTTLIEDILDVGRRAHDLPEDVVAELEKVDRPVRIQVMISPT